MRNGILLSFLVFLLLSMSSQAGETSTYDFSWLDPDKEVYVLQNRKFRKNKSLFVNVGFGKALSGPFVDSTHFQGRIGYYFKEDWGLTVLYNKNSGEENETALSVKAAGANPFRRIVQDYQAILVNWAPFYSKVNAFNKVFYYDFILGLGLAKLNEENNRVIVNTPSATDAPTSESHTGLALDIGTKFFISKSWSADINLTSIIYKAKNGRPDGDANQKEIYYDHWDLTVGIGYTF